ncbi:WecB/TagA/CpsF family glycosyltransferase [Cypionkella sp.]|uniref:WecB/TagA/CpsF family glycosyltransferase n=1 Tax=Cypionkella sp. TaxID=2811411 RepID=UPI0026150DFA|nr:WecB/TagA/CpsF family glycosyltransferase [Cypionkella sp.]
MQFGFATAVIKVNLSSRSALLAAAAQRFAAGEGFALATINLDHLAKLRASPAFRAIYAAQDFVVADGHPIVWLSWLAGRPVDLVPGSDMVLPLVQLAMQSGRRVALIGSTEEALTEATTNLESQTPGLKIALTIAPPMGFDPQGPDARSILARLTAADIGFCVLALPAGKQEALAALGRSLAPNTGFASFGAGLDFLAGNQTRAPRWMRGMALEWLWRALSNPRRMLPRYAACFAILPSQIVAAWRLRGT